MLDWEKFEITSEAYLKQKFGKVAGFELQGGSDSTRSDIKVTTLSGQQLFYIEAKSCPAQCGQFVLLPNIATKTFDYSPGNSIKINNYSQDVISYMNCFFEDFKEAGTAGKDIFFENCSNIFADWIINFYSQKEVRFIITNGNIILPVKNFKSCFSVTAKYRTKRSGSSSVPAKDIAPVSEYMNSNFPVSNILRENGKLFVSSNINLDKKRFIIAGREYMFAAVENRYEIRKLSNTFNANVIFSINLKQGCQGLADEEFIAYLH